MGPHPSPPPHGLCDPGCRSVSALDRGGQRGSGPAPGKLGPGQDRRTRPVPSGRRWPGARRVPPPLSAAAFGRSEAAGGNRPRAGGRSPAVALRRTLWRARPHHTLRTATSFSGAAQHRAQDRVVRYARRPRGADAGLAHRAAQRRRARPAASPTGVSGRPDPRGNGLSRQSARSRELFGKRGHRMNSQLASEILSLSWEHLQMVLITIAIAIAVALPGGVLLARRARARRVALSIAGIAQTIPSLALFGFLVPLPWIGGIGPHTAIIALSLYALLPILRNTLLGITGVDQGVRESAVAMGMTGRQVLWQVELPLAVPAIVAGLRLATVATIGTATIAAAIGGGGLGVFIFRGISMVDTPTVLAGALPAALMAVVADEVLEWIERKLSPA